MILVSNEVGWGVVPPTRLGRLFRDIAGRANQVLAQAGVAMLTQANAMPQLAFSLLT